MCHDPEPRIDDFDQSQDRAHRSLQPHLGDARLHSVRRCWFLRGSTSLTDRLPKPWRCKRRGFVFGLLKTIASEETRVMKSLVIPMALLLALSVPALAQNNLLLALSVPALTQNNQGQNNNNQGGGIRPAPGPLVGAGLSVLLIGGGIYWLVRRRKGQARTP